MNHGDAQRGSSDVFLRIRGLRKEYGDVVALADVSLDVARGEILGLIGPNGAGKTTLLTILATTLQATAGRVEADGRDITADLPAWRGRIGYMADFFQLYHDMTVRGLLRYFGIAHRLTGQQLSGRIDEVLHITGLTDKADALVKGLSRGMTQRLGMARAILHRPQLLLLDEPASGLDPLARRELFRALRAAHAAGATILISSHILGELSELCSAVGIMHEGQFLEAGRTDAVMAKVLPGKRLAVKVVTDPQQAADVLGDQPGVADVLVEDGYILFAFDGDDRSLAELNARLVARGVGIARLEETRTDLHEVYFAIADGSRHASTQ